MSKTREIEVERSATIGRDALVGGRMAVAGSVTIGHNLKVKGWLDAENVKGANKGFFQTVEKLNATYPEPKDGWIAGVGNGSPFAAYVGDGGVWTATGGTIVFEANFAIYDDYLERMGNVLNRLVSSDEFGERLENVEITADNADNLSKQNGKHIRELYETPSFLRFITTIEDADIVDGQYTGRPNYYAQNREYIVYVRRKKVMAYKGRDGKYYSDWVQEYDDNGIEAHRRYNETDLSGVRRDAVFYEEDSGEMYVADINGELQPVGGDSVEMVAITEEELNQIITNVN